MEKNKRNIGILLILFVIFCITPLTYYLILPNEIHQSISPLTGLPFIVNGVLLNVIWPVIGSILLILVFTFVLTPGFLKLKNIIWSKYTDSYIDLGDKANSIDFKKFIKRVIYIFLLTYGIYAVVSNYMNFDLLISEAEKNYYAIDQGITDLKYVTTGFLLLMYLIIPISVGIWSISWAMEDIGLMHYKVPEKGENKLYEIEPVHLKYNNIIKGYAGISSLIFVIGATMYYIEHAGPGSGIGRVVIPIIYGINGSFTVILAYLIYYKFALPKLAKKFQKGKQPLSIITKDQLVE